MKRIALVCLFAFLIPAAMVWSGGKKEAPAGKIVFGNIPVAMSDEWNGYSVENFKYAAAKKGVEVIVLDSEWNGEKALNNL